MNRLFAPVLIISLLAVSTGCGNWSVSGSINAGSTIRGSISFVQLGNVLNGTGGTIQVTFVTFVQNGASSTFLVAGSGFDSQRAGTKLDRPIVVPLTTPMPTSEFSSAAAPVRMLTRSGGSSATYTNNPSRESSAGRSFRLFSFAADKRPLNQAFRQR